MKKFLGILAIAGVLVACDNTGNGGENKDSLKADTNAVVTPVMPDSNSAVMDTTTVIATDSLPQ